MKLAAVDVGIALILWIAMEEKTLLTDGAEPVGGSPGVNGYCPKIPNPPEPKGRCRDKLWIVKSMICRAKPNCNSHKGRHEKRSDSEKSAQFRGRRRRRRETTLQWLWSKVGDLPLNEAMDIISSQYNGGGASGDAQIKRSILTSNPVPADEGGKWKKEGSKNLDRLKASQISKYQAKSINNGERRRRKRYNASGFVCECCINACTVCELANNWCY